MTLDNEGKKIEVDDRVRIRMKSGFSRYGWVKEVFGDRVSVMADGNTNFYLAMPENVTVINQPCLERQKPNSKI